MGQGLSPSITSAAQIPTANPALASNPAPPQAPQTQTPMSQASTGKGSPGGKTNAPAPTDPAQVDPQGQQPQMGQPNQYSQTVGMGNNTSSQTPSPIGAGGKSGKGA